jgi:hypothetical protein
LFTDCRPHSLGSSFQQPADVREHPREPHLFIWRQRVCQQSEHDLDHRPVEVVQGSQQCTSFLSHMNVIGRIVSSSAVLFHLLSLLPF